MMRSAGLSIGWKIPADGFITLSQSVDGYPRIYVLSIYIRQGESAEIVSSLIGMTGVFS